MRRITLDLSTKKLQEMLWQLPPEEFLSLADAVAERAETLSMMKVAETGFQEWNEPGEDVYAAQAESG
jgi:hypothetical protein